MKVSHELPLGLMQYAYKWNDYDYCLPHLIDKYDQYRLFFQKARLDQRFIIMDNGLFEGVKHRVPEDTNFMAVCQGESLGELITTYQNLVDLGYKYIAFNHSSCAYYEMYHGMDGLKRQMYGRMELIKTLVKNKTIDKSIHHHLLGCSLPQEFREYDEFPFIKSVDTSNPILVGAEGKRYKDSGMSWKPKEKLEHYFDKNLDDRLEDIKFNVEMFKTFIK